MDVDGEPVPKSPPFVSALAPLAPPFWSPADKIAAPFLAPYLARRIEGALR